MEEKKLSQIERKIQKLCKCLRGESNNPFDSKESREVFSKVKHKTLCDESLDDNDSLEIIR